MKKPKKKKHKTFFDVMLEDELHRISVEITPKHLDFTFGGEPVFNHPEIKILYEFGPEISDEELAKLLALPRATLIEDLNKIIYDSCQRYTELTDKKESGYGWRTLHALFFMRELEAEECLEPILDLLSQDEDVLDQLMGQALSEVGWSFVAVCGKKNPERLNAFMKETGRASSARITVVEAVTQLALNNLIDRDTAVNWLKDLLEYYHDNRHIENLIDTELNGFLLVSYIDLRAHELSPLIERMFVENLVPLAICGDWQEVQKEMGKTIAPSSVVQKFETIFESYNDYRKFHKDFDEDVEEEVCEDEDYSEVIEYDAPLLSGKPSYSQPQTYVREEPKIGRNDACHCGSGKKYKKCHGNNLQA